jgi:hypothetical protein
MKVAKRRSSSISAMRERASTMPPTTGFDAGKSIAKLF